MEGVVREASAGLAELVGPAEIGRCTVGVRRDSGAVAAVAAVAVVAAANHNGVACVMTVIALVIARLLEVMLGFMQKWWRRQWRLGQGLGQCLGLVG